MNKHQLSKFYGEQPSFIKDGCVRFPEFSPQDFAHNFENDNRILNVICRDEEGYLIDPLEFKTSPSSDPLLVRTLESLLSRLPSGYMELSLDDALSLPVDRYAQFGSEVEDKYNKLSALSRDLNSKDKNKNNLGTLSPTPNPSHP